MPSSSGQPGQGKKIGHRGVDASGETTYKKVYAVFTFYLSDFPKTSSKSEKEDLIFTSLHLCLRQTTSSALKGAIQLGIGYTVGNLSSKPERDVLMQDFYVVESIFFPRSAKCSVYIKKKKHINK